MIKCKYYAIYYWKFTESGRNCQLNWDVVFVQSGEGKKIARGKWERWHKDEDVRFIECRQISLRTYAFYAAKPERRTP